MRYWFNTFTQVQVRKLGLWKCKSQKYPLKDEADWTSRHINLNQRLLNLQDLSEPVLNAPQR